MTRYTVVEDAWDKLLVVVRLASAVSNVRAERIMASMLQQQGNDQFVFPSICYFVLIFMPTTYANNILFIFFLQVDCPGHASLIRTIIGGAQIMDVMLLVGEVMETNVAYFMAQHKLVCAPDRLVVRWMVLWRLHG